MNAKSVGAGVAPRGTAFSLGGALCCAIGSAADVVALHGSELGSPRERQPSGVLRAVLALVLGAYRISRGIGFTLEAT